MLPAVSHAPQGFHLVICKLFPAATKPATNAGGSKAGHSPFPDQVSLKFGQSAEYLENQLAVVNHFILQNTGMFWSDY